ncbi:josephin-like protein isoform X2 [Diorhabda sublineata]|uniref:josephin-like protein isoform X2 n=1 Tax=Diorhabda sublineata TaxID=1163346 RepID=UPI0024E15475|nr:josephin-like protein isoform X2 [Diorhabda sublineata]
MTASGIYHEKQIRELCALHALNNLFQSKGAFLKSELDSICVSLSPNHWINPHKSMLGLGNYDINVIMKALQDRGYEVVWFDKRRDPTCLILDNISGFILNIPSEYKIGFFTLPIWRRHWVTVRQINGCYYNLDSKLESPQKIVVTSEVSQKQSWIKDFSIPPAVNGRDADIIQLGDIEDNKS